jgi:hypothetical protein
MQDSEERAILEDIIEGINELIVETRKQRVEVNKLGRELKQKHDEKQLTDMEYAVDTERLRRTHQNIDFCMRSLERQKKIAISKIQELE